MIKKKDKIFHGSGKITALQFQKHNSERVNVFIDNDYAFSLSAMLVVENHLRNGLELDQAAISGLQSADVYHLGLAAAFDLIALRPRSVSEIQTRLRQRFPALTPETWERILSRLKELGYLDDNKFAEFWVENRANFAPRGKLLIKQELAKKGVSREVIQEAIEKHLPVENEQGESIEEEQALSAARKKAVTLRAEDWQGFYRKLGGFLQRRGYDFEITNRIIKQLWRELKNDSADSDEDEAM
jgi:regulatory protein